MNHISIDGNLTKDPETHSPQGSEYTCIKFSIANNDESKKTESGYDKIPSFFDIKYWTKNVQYWIQKLVKGAPVTVQGRLKQERWTDKDTNEGRSRIVILAEVAHNQGFAIVVHDRIQQTESTQEQTEDNIPF